MRALAKVLLFAGLLLAPPAADALDAHLPEQASAPLARAEVSDGKAVWRVEVVGESNGRTSAVVAGAGGAETARVALPFDAGSEGWEARLAWLPKVTGGPLLAVEIRITDEAEVATFSALLRPPARGAGRSELLWRSGRTEAASGASWRTADTNGDGREEVVVAEQDRRLAACADRLTLHPQVLGSGSAPVPLRRASLVPTSAPPARPEPSAILDRFALDGAVSWVSHSDAALSAPNPVAALHDNRGDTVWAPSRDNPAGEFAVIKMVEGIALDGITLGVAAGSSEGTFLLHFDEVARRVVVAPGSTVTVRAPSPVAGGCTAVEVLSRRGRRPLLLSTIRPVTSLDTESVESIFERVLLPILKRSRSSGERSAVIRWLGTAGPALLPHLERAMRDELGERQAVLVLTALEFDGGDELLAHLAVEGVLDDEAVATWNRTNRSLSEAALTVVLAQFADGAPDVRLFPLVARTPSEAGNRAFISLLRSPSAVVRKATMAALPPNAPALLAAVLEQAINGDPTERAAWLETALKLSRHQRALEPGETARSVTASVDRLLTSEANADRRIGATLVGALALAERRETVAQFARHADNEWVRVSSLEAIARWRGATEAERSEASSLLSAALEDESPSVRMQAAELLAREPVLALSPTSCLALLRKEPWQPTRSSLLRILAREIEADHAAVPRVIDWLRDASERDRRTFLEDYRPSIQRADDRWLTLDAVTQSEPASRRALFFALGRSLTPAQQRFAEEVSGDRLEPDEVRLAAATVLARSGTSSWQRVAADLLGSDSAAAARRAAELLCAWTPERERGALADTTRFSSPYAVVTETLRTCKGMGSDPATGLPLTPR